MNGLSNRNTIIELVQNNLQVGRNRRGIGQRVHRLLSDRECIVSIDAVEKKFTKPLLQQQEEEEANHLSSSTKTTYPYDAGLNGITLSVKDKECMVIIGPNGPNGAGKATLFRVLNGDLIPSRGRGMLEGVNFNTNAHRPLSMCPQHNPLIPELTEKQHLYLYFHMSKKKVCRM